jgi:hypothetical protein
MCYSLLAENVVLETGSTYAAFTIWKDSDFYNKAQVWKIVRTRKSFFAASKAVEETTIDDGTDQYYKIDTAPKKDSNFRRGFVVWLVTEFVPRMAELCYAIEGRVFCAVLQLEKS